MAEYIDKNKLKRKRKYLFQTKGMPFPKSEYFIKLDDIFYMPLADVVEREKIKLLGEELRKFREGITDERVLTGFNMAIAICNKYLGESEDKE